MQKVSGKFRKYLLILAIILGSGVLNAQDDGAYVLPGKYFQLRLSGSAGSLLWKLKVPVELISNSIPGSTDEEYLILQSKGPSASIALDGMFSTSFGRLGIVLNAEKLYIDSLTGSLNGADFSFFYFEEEPMFFKVAVQYESNDLFLGKGERLSLSSNLRIGSYFPPAVSVYVLYAKFYGSIGLNLNYALTPHFYIGLTPSYEYKYFYHKEYDANFTEWKFKNQISTIQIALNLFWRIPHE